MSGLRKLEAFFGFLITVMAVSFGYEERFCVMSVTGTCNSLKRLSVKE